MRWLPLLTAGLLASACTRVALPSPVGKPVKASELADLKGDWVGERGVVWTVAADPGTLDLVAQSTSDGKNQRFRLRFSTVGDDVSILWAEDVELKAYLPFRILGTEDGDTLVFLVPDEEEVKRLVDASKVHGTFKKEANAWVLATGDFEPLLAGKAFWKMDGWCLVFRKRVVEAPGKPAKP